MVLFWGSWVEKEDVVRWFSKEIKNWRERKMVCGWGSQVRELYIRFLGIKISGQCSELTQKSLPVQRLQTHRLFFFFFAENFDWALANTASTFGLHWKGKQMGVYVFCVGCGYCSPNQCFFHKNNFKIGFTILFIHLKIINYFITMFSVFNNKLYLIRLANLSGVSKNHTGFVNFCVLS